MKHLKTYKLFESEFFDNDYIDTLLDKISDSGIESLSDIEKNQLKLFSEDDIEIIETIEKMADITRQFKEINQKMKDIQSEGGDAKYLMEDWLELNDQLVPLEQSFRKWGIELGDPRLDRLMRKTRPDAYNNIFESVNENTNELNDILLELTDLGYFVDIREMKGTGGVLSPDSIRVFVGVVQNSGYYGERSKSFTYDDVKEVFERMIDYMESEDFNILNMFYSTTEDPASHNLVKYKNHRLYFFGKEVDDFHHLQISFTKHN